MIFLFLNLTSILISVSTAECLSIDHPKGLNVSSGFKRGVPLVIVGLFQKAKQLFDLLEGKMSCIIVIKLYFELASVPYFTPYAQKSSES